MTDVKTLSYVRCQTIKIAVKVTVFEPKLHCQSCHQSTVNNETVAKTRLFIDENPTFCSKNQLTIDSFFDNLKTVSRSQGSKKALKSVFDNLKTSERLTELVLIVLRQ